MAGGVNRAARCQTWKSTTNSFAVTPATIQRKPDHTMCLLPWGDAHPEGTASPKCPVPRILFRGIKIFMEALTL